MKGVTAQFEELTVKFYLKQGGANSQIIPKKRLVKFHLGSDGEVYLSLLPITIEEKAVSYTKSSFVVIECILILDIKNL